MIRLYHENAFISTDFRDNTLGNWPAGHNYTFRGVNRDDYRIGTFEITNDQWNKFKNSLSVPVNGQAAGAYNYDAYWTELNVPTNRVSWYEAAQFVNWLNTSKGYHEAYKFTGTQGTEDYTLEVWSQSEADNGTNFYRHKDAFYYLPTEEEWVKAAYWNGNELQTFATPDNTLPIEDVDANYRDEAGSQPWNVGSGSEELNSTYDMMGNVCEWMENPYSDPSYPTFTSRAMRGASYDYLHTSHIASSYRSAHGPIGQYSNIGFRIAADVPEPSSLIILAVGGFAVLRRQ